MSDIHQAYHALVEAGQITHDPEQEVMAQRFDQLALALSQAQPQSGFLGLFKKQAPSVQGLYIWGGVGRGKSFLMDLFFENLEEPKKRRVHFHEFMDEMHTQIAAFRKSDQGASGDPIEAVVKPVVQSTRVLCFDEFHVTDITNAMLLGRLFEKLWAQGVVIVATSNVEPDNLYKDGLNRQLILPFIAQLKERCEVIPLDGPTDYRRMKLSGRPIFFFGDAIDVSNDLDALWHDVTGGGGDASSSVHSLGREIPVPREAMGAARFNFADLCEQPLGARDYLVIAHRFHTIMIEGIPQFSREKSSASKRFIQLIDTLYERGVKLLGGFAKPLEEIGADKDTAFEFQRCVSRLIEMQSEQYLARELRDDVSDS